MSEISLSFVRQEVQELLVIETLAIKLHRHLENGEGEVPINIEIGQRFEVGLPAWQVVGVTVQVASIRVDVSISFINSMKLLAIITQTIVG